MENISMLITNVFSYLILILIINNLFLTNVTKKCKFCLYSYIYLAGTISGILWNKFSIIIVLSGSLFILIIFKTQSLYWNIILFLSGWLILCHF